MADVVGRDLVVLTNVFALHAIFRARPCVAFVLLVTMLMSMLFHITVGEQVVTCWGSTLHDGLDESVLFAFVMRTEFGKMCRRRSSVLLLMDQICAYHAMVITMYYYGLPRFRAVVVSLGFLWLSDQTEGFSHAVLHSMWHATAFSVAHELILQ